MAPKASSYFRRFSASTETTLFTCPGERMIRAVTEPAGGATIRKSRTNFSRVCATLMLFA